MERLGRATWPEKPRGSGEEDGNRPNTIVKRYIVKTANLPDPDVIGAEIIEGGRMVAAAATTLVNYLLQ
jgi:hypothetical protein